MLYMAAPLLFTVPTRVRAAHFSGLCPWGCAARPPTHTTAVALRNPPASADSALPAAPRRSPFPLGAPRTQQYLRQDVNAAHRSRRLPAPPHNDTARLPLPQTPP